MTFDFQTCFNEKFEAVLWMLLSGSALRNTGKVIKTVVNMIFLSVVNFFFNQLFHGAKKLTTYKFAG